MNKGLLQDCYKKFISTSIILLFYYSPILAQTIRGIVKDGSGNPLPGVTITLKGTTNGTLTNPDGVFNLKLDKLEGTLVFSSVGYGTLEQIISNKTNFQIVLNEINHNLNELVVVAYGVQKKSDVTGAISSIKNKEFRDQPVANIAQSIEGKVSGINVVSPSGTPGAGLIVNIRGATNALYVVDGIPMLSQSNSTLSTSYNTSGEAVGNGQNISSIADLNPDDIESVEVLKDASAAALYGAQAANGVILITTKRGKVEKTGINFSYYTGIQTIEKQIKFLDASHFVSLTQEAIANDINVYNRESGQYGKDTSRFGSKSVLQGAGLYSPFPYTDTSGGSINTNWLNQIFRTAPIRNYEISARGGSEKTQFFISGSYFDQTGIIIENYLRRFNARVNLDHQATKQLSFGTTMSISRTVDKRSFNDNTYTGVLTNALGASPLMPVYLPDGSYAQSGNYQSNWLSDNPVKSAKEISAFTNSDRFLGSIFAEYKFLPSLKFRSTWSADYTNSTDDQYFSPLTVDAQAVHGKILYGNYRNFTWLNENILYFQHHFGANYIDALVGFTRQESQSDQININGQGFPSTGGIKTISGASIITGSTEIPQGDYTTSWLARINYTFKEKFLASFSNRYDISSRFAPGNRGKDFPSASLGYNLSEEDFIKNSGIFDALKFRVSYGSLGDKNIGNYQSQLYYLPGQYNSSPGLKPSGSGNPNLTWQTNTTFNIGFDFSIYHNRLEGSIEYFNAERKHLLSLDPNPGTGGYNFIAGNSNQIQDKGLEIQLNSNNIKTRHFLWTTSFNISFIKDKIQKLSSDNQQISDYTDGYPTHILKIGQPIGTFIGVPFAGVDPQTGDALYYSTGGTKIRADQVDFTRDETIIGKARPDYFGGISNNFSYKNWGLNISMPFSVGNKVYNTIRGTTEALGWSSAATPGSANTSYVYANTTQRAYDRRWQKPGDITDVPRPSFLLQSWFPNGSQFLENASYLKIRTINLSYTLKPRTVFSTVKIYAQVENLYTFTKYTGFDPEVSSTGGGNEATAGVDYAAYPPARTFTLGINLGF